MACLLRQSVLRTSTTLKASKNTKPGYTITPKWTGRAEVLVMGGSSGGLENAAGRVPSRVIKIETRMLYSSRVSDALAEQIMECGI